MMILLQHHVQYSSEDALHFTSCVSSTRAAVDSGFQVWQLTILYSPHFAVFLSPPLFLLISLQPPPPPNPNHVSLEARQLFAADELALLRQHSHTNTWSVLCVWE